MKKHTTKIIATAAITAVLVLAFWWGGNAPGLRGWSTSSAQTGTEPVSQLITQTQNTPEAEPVESGTPEDLRVETTPEGTEPGGLAANEEDSLPQVHPMPESSQKPASASSVVYHSRPGGAEEGLSVQEKLDLAAELAGDSSGDLEPGNAAYSQSQGMIIESATGKDKYLTDPVPKGKPVPVEPENTAVTDKEYTCVLSVRCDTILEHMKWLDPEKVELVPSDGAIFAASTVTFYEGESVFNVLMREMKKNRIHMEFVNTPMYNSAYIEAIGNFYEFDCGELSGWMYKVNGWFPNYGCSRYQLKPGDVVEWVYTCDLGIDVGGYNAIGG